MARVVLNFAAPHICPTVHLRTAGNDSEQGGPAPGTSPFDLSCLLSLHGDPSCLADGMHV
jgi:hypothetical protein